LITKYLPTIVRSASTKSPILGAMEYICFRMVATEMESGSQLEIGLPMH